ncbi:hypothetical protein DL98DRAFT_633031 [Cadophora sp. DSE1049]|nr:hypothetical protein DL98DRAFT_633031 [Cadophora sp. DSE1049]
MNISASETAKIEGYPKLAELQGTYPQLGIYRRFATLNARNLLYLQAELVDLEEHACLLQQRQLVTFEQPEEGNLSYLRGWLIAKGQGDYSLEGLDRNVWKDGKDLLVLVPSILGETFAQSISKHIFELYHRLIGSRRKPSDEENGLHRYNDKRVHRIADITATLLASSMPLTSIFVLYSVHNMWVRLGMVAIFTMLLSLGMAVLTKARAVEIFAATAAFASVQVVFVGSTSI